MFAFAVSVMEMITMARPKKNHILLTDADVKLLKAKIKSKDTNQISCRCNVSRQVEDYLSNGQSKHA